MDWLRTGIPQGEVLIEGAARQNAESWFALALYFLVGCTWPGMMRRQDCLECRGQVCG